LPQWTSISCILLQWHHVALRCRSWLNPDCFGLCLFTTQKWNRQIQITPDMMVAKY
jgi:hypothetical protein